MKRITILIALSTIVTLCLIQNSQAQRASRINVREIIRQLETDTDRFKPSLDSALDDSQLNGTKAEDEINEYVKRFEEATDRLRGRAEDREAAPGVAREVLTRARYINTFMRSHRLSARAVADWATVRNDLNRLAIAYNIRWRW